MPARDARGPKWLLGPSSMRPSKCLARTRHFFVEHFTLQRQRRKVVIRPGAPLKLRLGGVFVVEHWNFSHPKAKGCDKRASRGFSRDLANY